MTDATEADWPGEWPVRVYILHPEVKTYGDMVAAPERREYVDADKVRAWLRECEAEIDGYIRQEYPGDHPVHERCRKRDFAANSARIALAALDAKGESHE